MSSISYDTHGNTLSYIQGGTTTTLGWDGADRNLSARVTGADPAEITYTRDATDRIVRRDATQGDTTATVLYAHSAGGDSADITLGADGRLLTRSISLPGGALYTVRGGDGATLDHPTIRGDLCLTTDAAGHQLGTLRTYGPYGDPLTPAGVVNPDNVPDNQPGQLDYGWLGQHQRPHEHAGSLSLVQVGARPYSPLLGRFLSVDPIDGGSSNDYDYTGADPINTTDLDGKCWICRQAKAVGRGVSNARKWTRNQIHRGVNWVGRKAWGGMKTAWSGMKWVGRKAWGGMKTVWRGMRWIGRTAKWAWNTSPVRAVRTAVKVNGLLGLACFAYRSARDSNNSFRDSINDMNQCFNPLASFAE